MSIDIHKHRDVSVAELAALDQALIDYYRNPPPSYYAIADRASARYVPSEQPFHCDLVCRVTQGMAVLEVGCGTAHLCAHVEARGAGYTGLDYSDALLEENRRRFPHARFLPLGALPAGEAFDLVASLYTVEHVVNPQAYLEQLWGFCRPGGLIGVICPEFVTSDDFPPSLFYGRSPRRLREKIASLSLVDAAEHVIDLQLNAPRWKARARAEAPGAFWINLKPRILHGAEYSIDADAVHLPRLADLVWWFEQRGGEIMATSTSLPEIPASVLRYNCYVLAKKPSEPVSGPGAP
jgi:2-polyprenyl-3-methyl-5-hydroxy-6-metoxy-1,4-benzoquinol methylase